MKIASLVLTFIFFTSTNIFAQTESNTVSGMIKEVKPHFASSHLLLVNNVELILMSNLKDTTGTSFEINKEFKDLLVKKAGAFVLNKKYEGKSFKFIYNVNGKGWKCITNVSAIKVKKSKAKK